MDCSVALPHLTALQHQPGYRCRHPGRCDFLTATCRRGRTRSVNALRWRASHHRRWRHAYSAALLVTASVAAAPHLKPHHCDVYPSFLPAGTSRHYPSDIGRVRCTSRCAQTSCMGTTFSGHRNISCVIAVLKACRCDRLCGIIMLKGFGGLLYRCFQRDAYCRALSALNVRNRSCIMNRFKPL